MNGNERREKLISIIEESKKPVSGSMLSKELNVSRQVVVNDIQLLRAGGIDILSTNFGYVIESKGVTSLIKVSHKDEDFYDEMCTIVDMGAEVIDEVIEHSVYGRVTIPLNIANRNDAKIMAESFEDNNDKPLSLITGGKHFHTIKANNDIIILRVQKALNEKGYLRK